MVRLVPGPAEGTCMWTQDHKLRTQRREYVCGHDRGPSYVQPATGPLYIWNPPFIYSPAHRAA